jgi:hypothetical protein
MEQSNEIIFEVMITFPHLLKLEVENYNNFHGTDFEIIQVIDDEVPFCRIKVSNYKHSDIFDLGYSLAAAQYVLRDKGEIDW